MIPINRDGKGQPYIEWEQAGGHHKRAWIQRKDDPDKDWTGTKRYLNVARTDPPGRVAGNATDFPIFSEALSDAQILEAFVAAVCGITGCELP